MLQAEAFNFTKSNTSPWVFSRFLNCTNGTKSRKSITTGQDYILPSLQSRNWYLFLYVKVAVSWHLLLAWLLWNLTSFHSVFDESGYFILYGTMIGIKGTNWWVKQNCEVAPWNGVVLFGIFTVSDKWQRYNRSLLPSFQTLENSERKKRFCVFHPHCASLILRYIYYPKANLQKLRLAHNYLKLQGWLNRQLTLYEAHPNLHF